PGQVPCRPRGAGYRRRTRSAGLSSWKQPASKTAFSWTTPLQKPHKGYTGTFSSRNPSLQRSAVCPGFPSLPSCEALPFGLCWGEILQACLEHRRPLLRISHTPVLAAGLPPATSRGAQHAAATPCLAQDGTCAVALTVNTGQGAVRTTVSATLPSRI